MLFLKFKYFFYYYKSKILKNKYKKIYYKKKINFNQKLLNKQITNKLFLNNFEIFNYSLSKNKSKKFNYLEIGCFEGLSSYYILSEYEFVNAFLLDLWGVPNPNNQILSNNFDSIEEHFDQNLFKFKFTKINNDPVISMRKLLRENKIFDLIYIDGSQNREYILSDAIEAFKILKKKGLIFFDDFLQYDKNRALQSYEGIKNFLTLYSNYLTIEYFQNNLVVRKK